MRTILVAMTVAAICVAPSVAPAQPLIAATLEQRADGVYLIAPSAKIEALVAKVTPVDACVVEDSPTVTGGAPPVNPPHKELVCPGGAVAIAIDEKGVSFGKRRIALPGRATIASGLVPRVPAMACAPGTKGPTINVEPRYFYVNHPQAYGVGHDLLDVELRLPELGVVVPLATHSTRVHSIHLKAANVLRLWLGSGMSATTTFSVHREGDVLRIGGWMSMIGKSVGRHSSAAYWLPCGATVQMHKVSHTTAAYFSMGDDCPKCTDAFVPCRDHCEETLTDAAGALTEAGDECLEKCRRKRYACEAKCGKP